MSFWIRQRDKNGRRHLWLIDTDPFLPLYLQSIGIIAVAYYPSGTAKLSLALISTGFLLVVAAKIPKFRNKDWTSWGTSGMSKRHAGLYKAGYALMIGGAGLLLLAGLFAPLPKIG